MQSEQVLLPLKPIVTPASFVSDSLAPFQDLYAFYASSENLCNSDMANSSLTYPFGSFPSPMTPSAAVKTRSNTSSISANSDETEEHQQQTVIDERKQRRMISNRESARRSRMRKQKHLDELRAQVAHMRAENRQILSRFDILLQHYKQVMEENRLLKSRSLDLSQQLQHLKQAVAASQSASFVLNQALDSSNRHVSNNEESSATVETTAEALLNGTAKGLASSDILISC